MTKQRRHIRTSKRGKRFAAGRREVPIKCDGCKAQNVKIRKVFGIDLWYCKK